MKPLDDPTLAHRDLRNRSAEVLRRVQSGETFPVTNHGEVVAILSPADRTFGPRVRKATVRGGFAGRRARRVACRPVRAYVGASAAANLLVEEPDAVTFRTAGLLPGPLLWSLDALHVAAALHGDCRTMVTYDLRQAEAGRASGLRIEAPRA